MRSVGKILSFIFMLIVITSASNCAKKAPLVTIPPQPKEKLVLIHVENKSSMGSPIWIRGCKYYPLSGLEGFVQYGKASWYGPKFHGRKTSSGEVYNMHGKTAAHNTLPLGTYVQVVNLNNGKRTVVRINDRGPFVKNRVIDLSYGAAKEIGLVGPGVVKVKLIVLGKQVGLWNSPFGLNPILEVPNISQGSFGVQVGAFTERESAMSIADRLKVLFRYVEVVPVRSGNSKQTAIYRVRVSRIKTLGEATKVREKLKKIGFEEAFVVSL
ncbi:MAG TPA: septal ring lytic transglycosylase RlpA family protein [Desulfobacteraceae bacterium]|nr:septal ring lytic transglycosylase RlpA family protein [Desulfobacteraceae bacterium]